MIIQHLIFVLTFFSVSNIFADATSRVIAFRHDELSAAENTVKAHFPEQFILQEISWSGDVPIIHEELMWLSGLNQGAMYTRVDILRTIKYLFAKKNIKKVIITIDSSGNSLCLSFFLKGFFVLDKLSIVGIPFGKQYYHHMYGIQIGTVFDEKRHVRAIKKLKDVCIQEGYLDVEINPTVSYDHKNKRVSVVLTITRHKKYRIKKAAFKVDFDGAHHKQSEKIKYSLQKKFGYLLKNKAYDQATINLFTSQIQSYLEEKGHLFVDVALHKERDVNRKEVSLFFTVQLSQQGKTIFFGNNFFTSKTLQKTLLGLGRSVNLLPSSLLAEEIEKIYKSNGFLAVEVAVQEDLGSYFFLIKEGSRSVVRDIRFVGIDDSDAILLNKMFFKKIIGSFCNTYGVKKILQSIVAFYHERGFFGADVSYGWALDKDDPELCDLTVTVVLGKRVMIRAIDIPGFEYLTQKSLFTSIFTDEKSIVLSKSMLESQRIWLLNYFRERGYRAIYLDYDLQDDSQGTRLVWRIKGAEKRFIFGKTIINGVSPCAYTTLLNYLSYREGDLWSLDKLKQSFINLKNIGIFESISFMPAYDLMEENVIPVSLSFQKDDPYEARMRLGTEMLHVHQYHTLAGLTYRAGGSFIAKNPLGLADLFRFDVDLTKTHREIVARYSFPMIYWSPLTTSLQLYSIKHEHPGYIGNNKELYVLMQHGGLLSFEKKHMNYESNCSVGLEWMKTSFTQPTGLYTRELAKALNFEPRLVGKAVPFVFVEPTCYVDFTNDKLDPSSGSSLLFSCKGMFPLSQKKAELLPFIKFLFEGSLFVPIKQIVACFRLRLGYIFHKFFSNIMPSERFFLGGAHSLRSYPTDLTPPFGVFIDDKGEKHNVPRGGKAMINSNSELRFPFTQTIKGVVFQDLGILTDSMHNMGFKDLLVATGFGLRYTTPFGPLRFDIGFNWRRSLVDRHAYAWFLTFGHAF